MPIWKIILDHLERDPMFVREAGENQHLLGHKDRQGIMVFRLKDDDNIVYFTGIMDAGVYAHGSEEDAFAPLRWGMADSGCTMIEFLEGGSWTRL